MPSICELIHILKDAGTEEDSINEYASSIWNLANYLGEAIGPFLGGFLTSKYNFTTSCTSISFINIVFAVTFYYLNKESINKDLKISSEEKVEEGNKLNILINNLNNDFSRVEENGNGEKKENMDCNKNNLIIKRRNTLKMIEVDLSSNKKVKNSILVRRFSCYDNFLSLNK